MIIKMKENERIDELQRNGYRIIQNPAKFCFGMDAVLLSGFARAKKGNTVLDMGTGTGLEYICDSFLMEKASRFDIKGKRYIESPYKYYFSDTGLRNARLNFRQVEYTHLLENIIYNELISRGFSVDVGVVEKRSRNENGTDVRQYLEVDFVCNQGSKRYYIQSTYKMIDDEKVRQEENSLRNIDDSFKKIIILGEYTPVLHNESGITIMSIYDFLLKENSLEL